jgi:hypothetical protein
VLLVVCGACASSARRQTVAARLDHRSHVLFGPGRDCESDRWTAPDGLRLVRIEAALPCAVRQRLITSLELAVSVLGRSASCREMFQELGHDGADLLARTTFMAADARLEATLCHGAEAFTVVGSNWTGLCRDFSQLTDLEAAVVLLHEALHHAGVTEWPLDPDARRSSEISADVGRRCGLLSGR